MKKELFVGTKKFWFINFREIEFLKTFPTTTDFKKIARYIFADKQFSKVTVLISSLFPCFLLANYRGKTKTFQPVIEGK